MHLRGRASMHPGEPRRDVDVECGCCVERQEPCCTRVLGRRMMRTIKFPIPLTNRQERVTAGAASGTEVCLVYCTNAYKSVSQLRN